MKTTQKTKKSWNRLIADWQQSGLSKAAFCKERGIPTTSFHSAYRRGGYTLESPNQGFVKVGKIVTGEKNEVPNCNRYDVVIEGLNGIKVIMNEVEPGFLLSILSQT